MPVITAENDIPRKIRKYRDTLYIIGSGTIALGIWNAVRIFLMVLNSPQILITPRLTEVINGVPGIIVLFLVTAAGRTETAQGEPHSPQADITAYAGL